MKPIRWTATIASHIYQNENHPSIFRMSSTELMHIHQFATSGRDYKRKTKLISTTNNTTGTSGVLLLLLN